MVDTLGPVESYDRTKGTWRDASTGYNVGQEELAQTMHDETVARIAAATKTVKHAPARGLIVRGFEDAEITCRPSGVTAHAVALLVWPLEVTNQRRALAHRRVTHP